MKLVLRLLGKVQLLLDILLQVVLLVNLRIDRVDVKVELLPGLAQLLELVLKLVDTLACALVVLGNANRLLCLLHQLFLPGLDLGGILLLTRIEVIEILLHLVVLLGRLLDLFGALLKLILQFGDLRGLLLN